MVDHALVMICDTIFVDGSPVGWPALPRSVDSGNWFASTLARGLALMSAFGVDDGWLGNAELARRTCLPKSTVSRLSAELVGLGYLQRNARGQLRPGLRLLSRVYPVLRGLPIRELARPRLQAFAEQVDGVVAIAAAAGTELVLIETARGAQSRCLHPDEGHRLPMFGSAAGRALLADCGEARRALLLGRICRTWPALWTLHRKATFEAVDDGLRQGHCLSWDDFEPGAASLALGLLTLPDGVPLVLTCTVGGRRATMPELQDDLAPRLKSLAEAVRTDWASATALCGPNPA